MEFTNKYKFNIPEEYWTNDRLLLRFLAAQKNNYGKTLLAMTEYSQWLRTSFPVDIERVTPLL